MELVKTYFRATREEPVDGFSSLTVEERDFHAAHWASGNGRRIDPGVSPADPMPVTREVALELVNRWNRHSEHSPKAVKYWVNV